MARFVTIWGPSTLAERLANCEEMIAVAERLGDPVMIARAWWLRFRALTEMGEINEADRCLELAERLTAESGLPAHRWLIGLSRAGRVLLSGRVDEADRLFLESCQVGEAAGHPDALLWYAHQAFEVRLAQDRLEELDPRLVDISAHSSISMHQATFMALQWELGRHEEARKLFRGLADSGFASLLVNVNWLRTLTLSAETCSRLGEADNALVLYNLLAPYPDQFSVPTGVISGPVAYYLGLLATTLGRYNEAEERFAAAEATHDRIGAPCWLARTRLEWARMHLIRRQPGDPERARHLLGQALETARELGLANVERRAVALLGELE